MEYQIKIGDKDVKIEKIKNEFFVDGKPSPYTIERQGEQYVIHSANSVSTIYVLEKKGEKLILEINGKTVEVQVKDSIALMLEKLGIDHNVEAEVNDVKAPMPGVIISLLVEEGQEIKKGDSLLILEAMKMENMIKSPTDATIKSISIEKGKSVEKNETLISFE